MLQPDIEIYAKNASAEDLFLWLSKYFEGLTPEALEKIQMNKTSVTKLIALYHDHEVPIAITTCAAGKAFISIWIQSSHTPWETDLDCAQSWLDTIGGEVRCSAAGWTEQEEEHSEQWWCLTENEKRLIPWG